MALRTDNIIVSIYKRSSKWKNLSKEELVRLKEVFLSIADVFTALCDKYNLKYCMAFGIALGGCET